jgi:hypothetical protein
VTDASQLAFIRTQAEIFAWASVAAESLLEMGVIDLEALSHAQHTAFTVVAKAREDPKFIGDKLPVEFK